MWRTSIFTNIGVWKLVNLLQIKPFIEGFQISNQTFSYLLKFLRTLRTNLFYQTFVVVASGIVTNTHDKH